MLAGQFFNKFEQLVSKPVEAAPTGAASSATAAAGTSAPAAKAASSGSSAQPTQGSTGIPPWVWALVIGGCIVLFAYYFKQ
jgi:hypothetical protein